jgi:hypothetical protein
LSCFFDPGRDLPYRQGKYLQIRQTPQGGIHGFGSHRCMPALQAALRRGTLVLTVAFPHHAVQENTAPEGLGRTAGREVPIQNGERCGGE